MKKKFYKKNKNKTEIEVNKFILAFDKMRQERKVQEDILKILKKDFDKIKSATSGNLKAPSDIVEHKKFLK